MSDSIQPVAAAPIPAHFRRDAPQDAHQRRRHRAVLDLLARLPEGAVLDYGFGWGDIAWAAMRTHPRIRGVDVEARRVDFARDQYAPIEFDQCRPDGLDFLDASFDIVLSIVVLPFVPDDQAYLREIRRVLRPGGHLIIATKTSPFMTRWWRRLSGQRERDRHPAPGIRHHDAGDAERLLVAHGFRIVERRAFYDPPFEARKNPVDLVNGAIEVAGESLGLIGPAPYPLFLARRID